MKSLKSYLFIFSIFFTCVSGYSQWNSVGVPYGYDFDFSFIGQTDEVFLNCNDGIYFSDDQGGSWTNTGLINNDLVSGKSKLTETDNHDFMLNVGNDVYKFDKANKLWELAVTGIYPFINIDHQGWIWCRSGDVNKNGFYVTKDIGITYEYFESPETIDDNTIVFINSHLDEYNLLNFYNGTDRKMYRFTNDGIFTFLSGSGFYPFSYINPITGTVFYLNQASKLCRSTDKGTTLTPINLEFDQFIHDPKMCRIENGKLFFQTSTNEYISKDDGKSWTSFSESLVNGIYSQFIPNSFGFANSGNKIVITSNFCPREGIYTSDDNGTNWKREHTNLDKPQINKLIEDKAGNLYGFTCSDTTVLVTKDNGSKWDPLIVSYNGHKYLIRDMAVNAKGEIYALYEEALFKSINGGTSFINLNAPSWAFYDGQRPKIYISPDGSIVLKSEYFTHISFDDGKTWKYVQDCPMSISKIQLDDKDYLYFINNSNEFINYDPVKDLSEVFEVNNNITINDFELAQNGVIYFIGIDKSTKEFSLGISQDKMKSYSLLKNIQLITSLFSDDYGRLYAVRADGIYRYNENNNSLEFFTNNPDPIENQYYVSQNQNLYAYSTRSKIYLYDSKLSSGSSLKGLVFNDDNLDCSLNSNEQSRIWVQVEAKGNIAAHTYSGSKGVYNFKLQDGNYDVAAVAPNSLWLPCTSSTVTITKNPSDTVLLNVGLQVKEQCPYLSVEVHTPLMRRCRDNNIYVKYCNEGTVPALGASLKLILSDKLAFISSTVNLTAQNGQELSFDLGDIGPGDCGDLIVYSKLSCDAVIEESICIAAEISPVDNCSKNLPVTSVINKCAIVKQSSDPNDKTAFINGVQSNGKAEKNQETEYVIRFQNTGTDTAFRVVVADKLPQGYDLSTLKILNSSHPFNVELDENRKLKFIFIFDPIMLPDSNINEPVSHGFVAFKISQKPDLNYGTKLDNYADIYFDFNDAVRTNTSLLTVSKTTSYKNVNDGISFSYFPNPSSGYLYCNIYGEQNSTYTIRLLDILGNEIFKETFLGSEYKIESKKQLLKGIYFIDLEDSSGKHGFGKFVIN